MPWQPLPRIAFAVATYPFTTESPAELPLEIGDELYIIEETPDGNWLRGYLVAPPSLLAGLTSVKGQTLEARVFSGIFPRSCVEVRELLGESDIGQGANENVYGEEAASDSAKSGITNDNSPTKEHASRTPTRLPEARKPLSELYNGAQDALSIPVTRDADAPRPAAPVPMLKIGDENPTSASEPLIDEIASCLREWHSKNLHELLLSRRYVELERLSQLVNRLNLSRQQLLYNVLTRREHEQLRERTVWDLVNVNKQCGGEVIVRDPAARGRVLTADDSAIELTRLQSLMSLLDEPPQPVAELSSLHHILLEVKGFAGSFNEATTLDICLVCKPHGDKAINLSESFSVEIPAGGAIGGLAQDSSTRTLFIDLSGHDIGDAPSADSTLYLVAKVLSSHQQVVSSTPISRAGTDSAASKDQHKSNSAGGHRSSRRSLMWVGKGGRSTISRGNAGSRLDSVPEAQQEVQLVTASANREQHMPPSTAGSTADGVATEVQTVQRTVGVGVLRLNSLIKQENKVEQVIQIWSPTTRQGADKDEGEEPDSLIREVLEKPNGQLEKSRRGERLQVCLQTFNHGDADALIKCTPTLLSGVSQTNRIGFSGAPSKPRSDIYLTIKTAALSRQHLLSRYGGSATSITPALQGTSLQVSMEVRGPSGQRFENCIHTSSNHDAVTTFKSAVAEKGEHWNQTVRLSLPADDVPNAHVVIFLSDLPNAPFAVAHMTLWDQQAFRRDGRHGLLLYRIDENTWSAKAGPGGKGGYLSLPWAPRGKDHDSTDVTGPLAVIVVDSFLCSTRFSQDRVILGMLKWKDLSQEDLASTLRQLMFVPEIEVVKLLSDVLDGLFGVIADKSGNEELEDLVFAALVRVLDIVHDRRFNVGPLVDQYAEKQFHYPYAMSSLVRTFTRLLENPAEAESARQLRAALKVVRHILKFISQARVQMREKEAVIGIKSSSQSFTRQLRTIFKALDAMMRNTAAVLVGSQTLAVQHFHTWLPELSGLLTTEEIVHIAIDFMDSCLQVKGKLILYKLVLIINYSKLDLFSHAEQTAALCANTVRWIAPHWGHTERVDEQWRSQVRLCCSIVASQVKSLGAEIPDHLSKMVDSYLCILSSPPKPRDRLSLLFPTCYPFPSKPISDKLEHDEALAELSAVLSAVSCSPAGMQLELAEGDLTSMVEKLLRVHMSILNGEAFPSGWLSVQIYHHKSTMRSLQYLADIMLESFLPDPDDAESFDTELWKLFLTTLLKVVGSRCLALETFPEQKRRAVWKIAGDVREDGAELLRKTWEAIGWETSTEERARYGVDKIGGYQVQYVPTLVGPIVELCLSVHEGLRRMAVEVLQTMIVSEWTLSEDLTVVQTEMIECLDDLFKKNALTESMLQKLFVGELLARFEPLSLSDEGEEALRNEEEDEEERTTNTNQEESIRNGEESTTNEKESTRNGEEQPLRTPHDPLHQATRDLVSTVDEFMDLLVAVHSSQETDNVSNVINRLRLMEFLRDMQKEEIFIRYVHQLARFEAEARNQAEAGLALRLHADLYDWDPTRQTGALTDPRFPAQSMFERKELIYFDMIRHFEQGESWSNALTAYKELQTQYESNVFDFAKLARTQRAIATIYENMVKSERLVPKYFKVVYKGLGFPPSLRDKGFIYQAALGERASAFADAMQQQYPAAHVVTSGSGDTDAAEGQFDVEGQYLVVSPISPHRDLSHPVLQRARVSQPARDFLLSSHPQAFSLTTHRHTSGPVAQHSTEKLVFATAEPFPTLLRRSEIVDMYTETLDAHQTGLERIVRKTHEMTMLERRLAEGGSHDEADLQLLLDAVTVSVNPASEHSVVCYRKLLPEAKDEDEDEDEDEDADKDEDEDEDKDEAVEDEDEVELEPRDVAIKMALVDHAMMIKRCLALLSRSSNEAVAKKHEHLVKCFEATYSSELAALAPPPPDSPPGVSTPSTAFRRSLPSPEHHTPEAASTAAAAPSSSTDERRRSARFSFLSAGRKQDETRLSSGGRKQDDATQARFSSSGRKQDEARFSSVDWKQDGSPPQQHSPAPESLVHRRLSRDSSDATSETDPAASKKRSSVRKRLSRLGLGRKGSRPGIMGSLDEE